MNQASYSEPTNIRRNRTKCNRHGVRLLRTPGLDSGEDRITPGLDSGEDRITPGLDSGEDRITPGLDSGEDMIKS